MWTADKLVYRGEDDFIRAYQGSELVWEKSSPNSDIFYTSISGKVIEPDSKGFDANIVSNTYSDGVGRITFDGILTEIGPAFLNTDLSSIVIPQSVNTLNNDCFKMTHLKSLHIPDNVVKIYDFIIAGTDVEEITVDINNKHFDSRDNCNAIIQTDVPGKIILITGCKTTVIPDSVTHISGSAFYACGGLNKINIPSSITFIGINSFTSCYNLSEVIVNATDPPFLGGPTFFDNAPGRKIKVPAESLQAYKTAPGWSDYADDIIAQ